MKKKRSSMFNVHCTNTTVNPQPKSKQRNEKMKFSSMLFSVVFLICSVVCVLMQKVLTVKKPNKHKSSRSDSDCTCCGAVDVVSFSCNVLLYGTFHIAMCMLFGYFSRVFFFHVLSSMRSCHPLKYQEPSGFSFVLTHTETILKIKSCYDSLVGLCRK